MDKYERRRLRLAYLKKTLCGDKAVTLAGRIGREPSYVSRMLYPEGKAGKRRIADDMMEIIENAFVLPRGWLDMDAGDNEVRLDGIAGQSELIALWGLLLPEEQAELLVDIKKRAAHNRAVMARNAPKPETLTAVKETNAYRPPDRRIGLVYYGQPDRRHMKKKDDAET